MTEDVSVVIGACYGDEGKGHIVDYLAAEKTPSKTLVVRFNGGAQAGHTVVTPSGRRHVFHHFGAGTLAGASTYLSRHFLVNPMPFVEELHELSQMGARTDVVYVDPEAFVSTPFDMMLNQAQERRRVGNRHGSCGMGIWETAVRSKVAPLRVAELFGPEHLWREKLHGIREVYVPDRMHELDLTMKDMPLLKEGGLLEHFIEDCKTFVRSVKIRDWHHLFLDQFDRIVYEGAQGLRLDQNGPDYPHVSGSKTGLANVLDLQQEVGFPEFMHVWYVSRPYVVRHGAGPLHHEAWPWPIKAKDDTNVTNVWQGDLRFGWMDFDDLVTPIKLDLHLAMAYDDCAIFPHVAVTCCDHVEDPCRLLWFRDGRPDVTPLDVFVGHFRDAVFPHIPLLKSYGPKREDIARLESLGG